MKRSKYKNIKTSVDGIVFASQKEANRYSELKLLERAGEIRNLELQPRYDFELNGVKICFYKADFRYKENAWIEEKTNGMTKAGIGPVTIVEDCKGFKTAMYRLKKKMLKAFYNIDIRET